MYQMEIIAGQVSGWFGVIGAGVSAIALILTVYWKSQTDKDIADKKAQTDKSIAELRVAQESEIAQDKARRDYEYEARKRLYKEYEPLRFQLVEYSENALHHIRDIAENTRKGGLESDAWPKFRKRDYLKETVYKLLLPCTIYKLMTKRLTLVDLQLDCLLRAHYVLARAVYFSFRDDFLFAKLMRHTYDPYVEDWREKRRQNPQRYRRQGFLGGALDNALNALIVHESKEAYSIISFDRFEKQFNREWPQLEQEEVSSNLAVPMDMFNEFHPDTRPIMWCTLVTHALIYRCILETYEEKILDGNEVLGVLVSNVEKERPNLAYRPDKGCVDDTSKEIPDPLRIASEYFDCRVRQDLERVQGRRTL
jgi:hypothetical protein